MVEGIGNSKEKENIVAENQKPGSYREPPESIGSDFDNDRDERVDWKKNGNLQDSK